LFKVLAHEILLIDAIESGRAVFIKNSKIYSRKISRVLAVKAIL